MNTPRSLCAVVAIGLLAGCSTIPEGPSVAVMPAPNKPFEVFQNDDLVCRDYAARQIGASSQQVQQQQVVESAVVGTAVGAVAGAMIGHGDSEAVGVGAGTGLLMGTASGMDRAWGSVYSLQERYNVAYMQCMYAKGNQVPGFPLIQYGPPPPPPR
jgi:uncharacterized protein YcfJ